MKKKKSRIKSQQEIFMETRKDWGNINPVTKIIPDKRNKKPKHKQTYQSYED